jgi:hypothetical protein
MIIRGVTATNDWIFGNGLNSYFIDEAAIEANLKTRLLEWVGDCFFNVLAGVDWKNRLDYGQQANLAVEIKQVVLQSYGVVSILAFQANFSSSTRFDSITMTLQTIYSPQVPFILTPPIVGTI